MGRPSMEVLVFRLPTWLHMWLVNRTKEKPEIGVDDPVHPWRDKIVLCWGPARLGSLDE
jgi:hypothetical protein